MLMQCLAATSTKHQTKQVSTGVQIISCYNFTNSCLDLGQNWLRAHLFIEALPPFMQHSPVHLANVPAGLSFFACGNISSMQSCRMR